MTHLPFDEVDRHSDGAKRRSRAPRRRGLAQRRTGITALGLAAILPVAASIATPAANATTSRGLIRATVATPTSHAASACNKVSAASIKAIVGHAAPLIPAASSTNHIPASKATNGVSGTETDCVYGNASAAVVLLNVVTSKPLTLNLLKKTTLADSTTSEATSFTSYSGLGVPGFRVTSVDGSDHTDQIGGLAGNVEFSATGPTSLSVAKLAALAKLARKL